MPIVSSAIVTNRVQSRGQRKIREEHTDNLGGKHYRQFIAASGYDEIAGMVLGASAIGASLVAAEVATAISEYEQGGDPLYFEASINNWQKRTPLHQTWGELAASVIIDFLSREDRNKLHHIKTTITRVTTNDMKVLLGMTNQEISDVNAEIQNAVNSMIDLGAYLPFFGTGGKR